MISSSMDRSSSSCESRFSIMVLFSLLTIFFRSYLLSKHPYWGFFLIARMIYSIYL